MVSNGTSVYWTNTVGNLTIGGTVDTIPGKSISSNNTLYLTSGSSASIIFKRGDTNYIQLDTNNNFRPETTNQIYLGDSTYRWKGLFLEGQSSATSEGIQFYSGTTLYARIGATTTTGGLGIYGSAHLWFKPSLSDATLGFEVDSTAVYPTTTQKHSLGKTDKLWTTIYSNSLVSTYLNINTTAQTAYNVYINGTSYFNGNVTHNGYDYFANGTTYYIDNSGTANLYGLTTNSDAIIKGSITINNAADEPIISFKGSNNTNAWGSFGMARNTPGDGNLYSDHRFRFLNYSYDSNDNSYVSYYEYFDLPIVDANRTENANYFIITEKSFISGKSDYGEHNANNTILNGLYYYNSNGPSAQLGALSTDGGLYVQAYNSSWQGQIAQDYRDGSLYMRGKNNGTWTKWLQVMPVDLASTAVTNCNSVYKTGIYTNDGFTNRPSSVTDWGTLINYKLYETNNNYHRQIFLDCYDTDKIWTRSCSGGTWTSWKSLLNTSSGDPRYAVGSTSSTSYVLVTINKETSWMLNFTLKLYQGYVATDIQISGYNYGSNYWYSPAAVILGSTTTGAIKVYFGYTGAYKLWVAVDGSSYNGAAVVNICNGYTQIDLDNAITVTKVSSLPGTLQATKTVYRPYYRDETVANATSAGSCTGNAANVTGTVAIGHGGTGATTAAGARANLAVPAAVSSSYTKITPPNGSDGWIQFGSSSTYGILPGTSGGAGSGHCYIGTSSWYWAYAYIDNIYGKLNGNCTGSSGSCTGNAATATTASSCSGNAASATKVGVAAIWMYPNNSNEVNFGGTYTGNGYIYFGYRATDSRVVPTRFYFGGSGTAEVYAGKVYNAVWNDFAEYRKVDINEPGRVVIPSSTGTAIKSTDRLQAGGRIISDTFGCAVGKSNEAKTPLGMAGRVLAYPYRSIEEYQIGDCVCTAPNGTVDIMTRDEIKEYPDRIIGIVNEIPVYETWEQKLTNDDPNKPDTVVQNVKVNGRIWIDIK